MSLNAYWESTARTNHLSVIATSGPSATYPQRAYRNPLDALVSFLDSKHGANWCIWEFRAEGTGYPDSEVYGRIHHFPWPDHHPPPFALIPHIMGSMRNWLHRLDDKDDNQPGERVAVVHCKAGKGRSGSVATAYLISQEGWKKEDALQRFTERRMRVGFGAGVSIPSQLRYIDYIDRWTNKLDKQYVERPVEILEVHVWGLRDGVKVAIEGYVDEGKKVKCFHMFHRSERTVIESGNTTPTKKEDGKEKPSPIAIVPSSTWSPKESSQSDVSSSTPASDVTRRSTVASNNGLSAVIFRPKQPVIVPNSDINIDFERRSKAAYTGFAMVTSVAHVWFNPYFEGGHQHDSGIFEIDWDAMDGIKGSAKKGIRAFERMKVVWRYPTPADSGPQKQEVEQDTATTAASGRPISEPKPGEPIHESIPADWRGQFAQDQQENNPPAKTADVTTDTRARPQTQTTANANSNASGSATGMTLVPSPETLQKIERQLGIRQQTDESKDVSLAGSEDEGRSTTDDEGRARNVKIVQKPNGNGDLEGVQPYFIGKSGDGDGPADEGSSKDDSGKVV